MVSFNPPVGNPSRDTETRVHHRQNSQPATQNPKSKAGSWNLKPGTWNLKPGTWLRKA